MHTLERNKATIRTLFTDVLSAGRVSLIPELFAPDVPAAEMFAKAVAGLRGGFPDIRYTIEDLVAEDDRVAARWAWTGTHTNTFRTHPATQLAIHDEGHAVFTLRDHRITNVAMLTDRLGFLQQIGVVPAGIGTAALPALDPRRAPTGVYLIDTFTVPAAVRVEFLAATSRVREYIRTLDGFRGNALFTRENGATTFDLITVAAWESPAALASAKAKVAAYHEEIGFDVATAVTRWGVTMQRTICTAPTALQ